MKWLEMAELIELTTIPRHGRRFYMFSSYCLSFSVKASENAVIGLADSPGYRNIDHWIFIDKNGHTGIIKNNEVIVKSPTPELLLDNRFRKFWLTWYGGKIELGKYEESTPIFSKEIKKTNLKYITFSGRNQNNICQWKFMLPSSIERPVLKPIEGGKPYWVPYDGLIPYGALIGGYEYEFLYIIRAPHAGSLTPGKLMPSMRCGLIGWGGQTHIKTEFEILCAHDCIWVPTMENIIPVGAIAAGYTEYPGTETMYIGRVKQEHHIIPGKIAPSHGVCYFAYNDEEECKNIYEILVAPYSSPRCANTTTTPVVMCEGYEEHFHSNDEVDHGQYFDVDDDDDDDDD